MSDINRGFTFSATEQLTNNKLHALIDNAAIDPTFISGKSALPSLAGGDKFVVHEAATSTLKAVTYQTLLGSGIQSVTLNVNQPGHGFAVGDVVYRTNVAGPSGMYAKAKADALATVAAAGVVSGVAGANDFTLTLSGNITGLSGLSAGSLYYISAATAGALTATAPTVAGQYKKQVLIATSSTTATVNILLEVPADAGYVPPGVIMDYAGSTVPTGYLLCDGSAVSRATYANLFAAAGTTWGAGDGSTTFNLPDLRGRVCAGKDNMGGTAANRITSGGSGINGSILGAAGGSETQTLTTAQIPAHNHSIGGGFITGAGAISVTGSSTTYNWGFLSNTDNTGGGQAHNNTQPTIMVNKIIKI
jgi:microcystin-dependent protein